MSTVRRWYIYLVSAISLQSVSWATIALLRQLLLSQIRIDRENVALQLAVIIIGLPIFMLHWLWAQRLASSEDEENYAALRYLYIYGTIAGFLIPIMTNAFDLVGNILGVNSTFVRQPAALTTGWAVSYHLIPILLLALLSYYHVRLLQEAASEQRHLGAPALIRRTFVLGFSAVGVGMLIMAVVNLSDWIMLQIGGQSIAQQFVDNSVRAELTRLIIALPVWLIFWRWAGRLFGSEIATERHSALRKFYLYAAIFIGAISVVSALTLILAGLFRRLLSLASQGGLRTAIATVIGMGLLWFYHSFVLRSEDETVAEQPRQASIRRLYYYLIAAIGLMALLIGLGGNITTIINALDSSVIGFNREQIAYFSAALISGSIVWLLPWRQIVKRTDNQDKQQFTERNSVIRKIYLYFYLFLATMALLGSAIFIVFKLLSSLLGVGSLSWVELAQALSLAIIGLAVWLYHGYLLREDWQQLKALTAEKVQALRIAYVGAADTPFASSLIEQFGQRFRGANLTLLDPDEFASLEGQTRIRAAMDERLASMELIIAPAGLTSSPFDIALAAAVHSSPAHKFLLPLTIEDWDWIGVARQSAADYVHQTLDGVEQFMAGKEIDAKGQMGAGAIIASLVGGFILLIVIVNILLAVTSLF